MKSYRLALLIALGVGTLASGCTPIGATRYPDSRRPEARYPDTRRPDARYPDPRRSPDARRADVVVYRRVARDAERYVQTLDRRLRLDRRQERIIHDLLTDRAFDRVTRKTRRDRDRAYPFPRRAGDRATAKWWRAADKRIARELNREQRRVYKDLTRQYERSARRNDRNRGRHDNGRRRRGGGN